MKKTLMLLLVLSSTSAFADVGGLNANGAKAKALYKALVTAGASGDCGAGTCGAEVANLNCEMLGHLGNQRSYYCSFGEEGENRTATEITGTKAKQLFNALAAVGVPSDGAAGTIGFGLLSDVSCFMHGNASNQRTYECSVLEATE